jgi:hypothetical protein
MVRYRTLTEFQTAFCRPPKKGSIPVNLPPSDMTAMKIQSPKVGFDFIRPANEVRHD